LPRNRTGPVGNPGRSAGRLDADRKQIAGRRKLRGGYCREGKSRPGLCSTLFTNLDRKGENGAAMSVTDSTAI
jgi:hypothetical protein